MSFPIESFRASRREVEDISVETGAEVYDANGDECKKSGYVYAGGLYIEVEADGSLTLNLVHDSHKAPASALADLEVILHAFGVEEKTFVGIYDEWSERRLIDELQTYCNAQNLPHESADELMMRDEVTAEQRAYLQDFCTRWEQVQR